MTNKNMTPDCLLLLIVSYWTTNQKPFLVQILIYKNGIRKQILREDENMEQEESQDYQRSVSPILDSRLSEQLSDVTKIQSPRLKRR